MGIGALFVSPSYENLNKQFFKWVDYHMKNHPCANWSVFLKVIAVCGFLLSRNTWNMQSRLRRDIVPCRVA